LRQFDLTKRLRQSARTTPLRRCASWRAYWLTGRDTSWGPPRKGGFSVRNQYRNGGC